MLLCAQQENYGGNWNNMLKRIFRNKEYVFAFAEAAIIFFSFIIVTSKDYYSLPYTVCKEI